TTITGTVKSASTGAAISGATVSDGTNSTTTDSSGRYILIEPNKNATYTVTASASGHISSTALATTTSLKSTTLNFSLL
ncbi:MAG TPA: carboxypeptidase regulatory-like domain-containing protein, partial [Ktedonobacterales bacterium]|nr:carboxypeptidase regulatory-like domain-containing protein [Ktedonobacterales bacterium]